MYGYTLLVPMNQKVLNKLSKERNISGHHKWPTTHRVLKSHKSKMGVMYMCPSAWVAIKPLWWQPEGHIVFMITYIYIFVYITPILLLWNLSTLCVVGHLWPLTYIYIHIYIYVPLRPTFYSYFKESFGGKYHIYIYLYISIYI